MKISLGKIIVGCELVVIGLIGRCANKEAEKTGRRTEKFYTYMENSPASEVEKLTDNFRRDAVYYTDMQSALDSVAYRKIFNSTQASKNLAAIKEFNTIASKTRAEGYVPSRYSTISKRRYLPSSSSLYKKLKDMNVSYKEFNAIEKVDDNINLQYITDSVAYRRFFEKYNILNDSVVKQIKRLGKQIKM